MECLAQGEIIITFKETESVIMTRVSHSFMTVNPIKNNIVSYD